MKWRLGLIGMILLGLTGMLAIVGVPEHGSNSLGEYDNIQELVKNTYFNFQVPEEFVEEDSEYTYKNIGNQMVEISNASEIFRAARFIDEGADVTGNYEEFTEDNAYNVKGNTAIKYLRIRRETGTNKVVVNYHTGDISYGIEYINGITDEEILDVLGLSEENLEKRG